MEERERESLVYAFFFHTLHLSASSKTTKFQGGCDFFSFRILNQHTVASRVRTCVKLNCTRHANQQLWGCNFFSPYVFIAQVTSIKCGIFGINAIKTTKFPRGCNFCWFLHT